MIGIVIFSGDHFGGVERRFARLAAYLAAAGHDVRLFCTADAAAVADRLGITMPDERVWIMDRPSTGFWLRDKLNRVFGLVNLLVHLWQRKVRHVHLGMNPGLVATIFSFTGLPYSISVVDTNFDFQPWLFKRSILGARTVDCLSESLKREVERRLAGERLPSIHASPCSFTDPNRLVTAPVRDLDVTLIARDSPEKGRDLLAAALKRLPGLNVHAGPTADPFAVLAHTKVFVSLQRHDNYPSQALLEAMYSGCAVIATDVGETRRLLDESCAVLIPSDPVALAEAIRDLLGDDAQRARLGEAARERVRATQTIERYAEYFLSEVAVGG